MAHFWLFLDLRPLVVLFLSFLAPHASSSSQQSTSTTAADQCKTCRFLVKSFMEGLDLTESHFGGGNTDWEEKKLGKFSTSETRFVEAMEFTCKSEDKDSRFKCHSMAEKYEELLEQWFFQHQDDSASNLEHFLCSEQLKVCCPTGQFGPDCQPCPGLKISATTCFGRGLCDGSGSREGNGSCRCWDGYVGKMCSNCDSNHFPTAQNASFVECKACFVGCASGCSGEGPKGCRACATGFEMDAEQGCQDIDECARGECAGGNQVCVNNVGSFECQCMPGFKRSEESGECELDFEDAKSLEPDNSNVRKEGDEEEEPEEEEEEQSKKDDNDDDENDDDDAGMASLKKDEL